jgi:hypothetical protein
VDKARALGVKIVEAAELAALLGAGGGAGETGGDAAVREER